MEEKGTEFGRISSPSSTIPEEPPTITGRRVFAGLLSAVIPGLGHLIFGRKGRGLVFAAGFATYALIYLLLRVPASYPGLIASIWLLVGLCCAAGWDALRCRVTKFPSGALWWLILILPVGFLSASIYANVLLRAAGFQYFDVPSTSMENTIMRGDHVIADLRAYRSGRPLPGDVVLFRHDNLYKTKRAIAVGPSTVKGEARALFVNNNRLAEKYAIYSCSEDCLPELTHYGPIRVPSGKLFVIGDNRDVSLDSRTFGPIEESTIIGKPLYVIRPLSRAGILIQ